MAFILCYLCPVWVYVILMDCCIWEHSSAVVFKLFFLGILGLLESFSMLLGGHKIQHPDIVLTVKSPLLHPWGLLKPISRNSVVSIFGVSTEKSVQPIFLTLQDFKTKCIWTCEIPLFKFGPLLHLIWFCSRCVEGSASQGLKGKMFLSST